MKRKHLVILIILLSLIFVSLIILGYYIFISASYIPKVEILEDSTFIRNHILENEKDNLKTFVAVQQIDNIGIGIGNKKKYEFYGLVLMDTYNVEGPLLEHVQTVKKLYKIVYIERKSY